MNYINTELKPASLLALLSIVGIDLIYGFHSKLFSVQRVFIFLIAACLYLALFFLARRLRFTLHFNLLIVALLGIALTILFFITLYLVTTPIISTERLLVLAGNIVRSYLLYAWLTLITISTGHFILKKFRALQENAVANYYNEFGLGIVSIMILYYILNLLHLVWAGPCLLGTVTLFALRYYGPLLYAKAVASHTVSFQGTAHLKLSTALWITAGAFALFLMFSSFTYQYFDPDDMRQYISVPLHFLKNGGSIPFSLDILNQTPQLGAYLVLPLLQLGGAAASIMNGYFLIATILVWLSISKHFLSPQWLLNSAVLLLTMPLNFLIYGIRPDGVLTFLLSLAFYNVLTKPRSFFLAGIYTGIAIGIKYNAFLALPALITILIAHTPWRKILRVASLFAGGAVLASLPWLTVNVAMYGNPVHPVQLLSPSINALTAYETNPPPLMRNYLDELELRSYRFNRQTSLIDKIIRVSIFPEGWIINHVGPLLLLAFLALLWVKPNKNILLLTIASATSLLAWHLLQVNQMHYILFLMPIWILIIVYQLMISRARVAGVTLSLLMTAQFIAYAELPLRAVHAAHELSNDPVYQQAFADTGLNRLAVETADMLNQIEKQNPDYIAMIFDRADIPHINNSYRHIEHNFAATSWFTIVADDPDASTITKRLRKKNITYLIVPNIRPLYKKEDCYIDGCPLTEKMYQQLDAYLITLEKIAERGTVSAYTVPTEI